MSDTWCGSSVSSHVHPASCTCIQSTPPSLPSALASTASTMSRTASTCADPGPEYLSREPSSLRCLKTSSSSSSSLARRSQDSRAYLTLASPCAPLG